MVSDPGFIESGSPLTHQILVRSSVAHFRPCMKKPSSPKIAVDSGRYRRVSEIIATELLETCQRASCPLRKAPELSLVCAANLES